VTRCAERIAILRWKARNAKGLPKVEALAEIKELERRYALLARRLQALNSKGPGLWQNVKADIEKVADDFLATLGDFIIKLDSHAEGRGPGETTRHSSTG